MERLWGMFQAGVVGKRTIAATLALVIVRLLESYGISLEPGWQEALETVLGGLIIVFLRLGMDSAANPKPKEGEDK